MKPGMPPEFRSLMERYCQLGRLLPHKDDLEDMIDDPHARAETELVLQEMAHVMAQIDDFLATARSRRQTDSAV
jgi:hypothetical protein